ncbi:MAG TPA: hypothetical protein VKG02_09000 [Blastocatellia bacterium]|nr:hypothetical protein [Blastocatellia bacterium]
MMKMLFVISIWCFCLFTASAVAPVGRYDAKAENGQELACEISVPSEAHVNNGWIDASLIVRNVSGNPVRICTLCSGSRHVWKGNYKETFRPDWWKSDSPSPEMFVEKIVTLNPKDTFTFEIKINYADNVEFWRGHPLTISSGYSTGEEFAKKYDTWSGAIEAKTVTVNVVE